MNKSLFYDSIGLDSEFKEEFFKKVYGYSVCDDQFITAVSIKLCGIGRKDVIKGYNEWFARWQEEYDRMMKGVAKKYREECERVYQKVQKENQEKVIKKCKTKTWDAITTLLNYQLE